MSKMYEALKKAQEQGVPVSLPIATLPYPVLPKPVEAPPAPAEPRPASSPEGDRDHHRTGNELRSVPVQLSPEAAVIPWNGANSLGGEQYRIIRTRIAHHPLRPKLIAVSSAGSGDGKTVSAINIAGVMSLRDDAMVLLADADFRRRGVSSQLGLPAEPGLATVLSGACSLQQAIVRVEQFPNLYILPAGRCEGNPAELLDSDGWKRLCATVRERFSMVIVDGPPIAAVADYELIQDCCDGVVAVVRPDHTDRTLFQRAFDLIPESKRLGVVVNCTSKWFLWKTHESYYYETRES